MPWDSSARGQLVLGVVGQIFSEIRLFLVCTNALNIFPYILGTYIFGGNLSPKTFEYLPNNSSTWELAKIEIPGYGYSRGCAVYVKSKQEIWLIGGKYETDKRILVFEINTQTFRELSSTLWLGRYGHSGALIPGTSQKILITGGAYEMGMTRICEVIDIENGGEVSFVSSMSQDRCEHGIGTLKINNEERLAVFGGCDETYVELFNVQTENWEIAEKFSVKT